MEQHLSIPNRNKTVIKPKVKAMNEVWDGGSVLYYSQSLIPNLF